MMDNHKLDEILKKVNSIELTLNEKSPAKLRFDFIGMAFAFAVAEIGLEIADFYSKGFSLFLYPNVFSHLALSVFIIASSWIGWQRSKSKGSNDAIEDPFSISFIILIIDLFLVICYFIVVRNVDKPTVGSVTANSNPEIKWSIIIFEAYFVWDVFSKLIGENTISRKLTIGKKEWKEFGERGYQAVICLAILYFVVKPMGRDSSINGVVLTDLCLISTFALFRGLKALDFKRFSISFNVFVYIGIPLLGYTIGLICFYFL